MTKPLAECTYRWLDGPDMDTPYRATEAEWSKIDEILAARGWMSLNRQTTRIRIAEGPGGQIAGFLVLQLVPHTEPLWVAPSQRGTGVAERLADDMVKFLDESAVRGFMLVADSDHAAKLAEDRGMKMLDRPVYTTRTQ